MNRRFAVALVVAMMLTVLLVACGGNEAEVVETKDMIRTIQERGVMKVGVGIFIPWSFKDKDGNMVGFEVDVATKVAEDMGVDVEFVPTDWSGIIPAMLTGKFDVIIGGMGITPERATKVNFTIPYEYGGFEVLCSTKTMPGLGPDIADFQKLNSPDVTLSLGESGTPLFYAEKHLPLAKVRNFVEHEATVQDILNGNSDCSITSPPKFYRDVRDNPDELYMPFGAQYLGEEYMAFALPKGELDALNWFDSWIRVNGEFLQERADYWYASADWEYLLPEE